MLHPLSTPPSSLASHILAFASVCSFRAHNARLTAGGTFEELRAENIRRNEEKLKELFGDDIAPSVGEQKSNSNRRRRGGPTRKSWARSDKDDEDHCPDTSSSCVESDNCRCSKNTLCTRNTCKLIAC